MIKIFIKTDTYYHYYRKKYSHKNSVSGLRSFDTYTFSVIWKHECSTEAWFHQGDPLHSVTALLWTVLRPLFVFIPFFTLLFYFHVNSLLFVLKENLCHNWRYYNIHLEWKINRLFTLGLKCSLTIHTEILVRCAH